MSYIVDAQWITDVPGGRRQSSTRGDPYQVRHGDMVGGRALPFSRQADSNWSVERVSLEERFERWSISTPTTAFDSL